MRQEHFGCRIWLIAVIAAALIGFCPTRTSAQQIGAIEAWGGLATSSPQLGVLGESPGMNFAVVALRWSRVIGLDPATGELPALEMTFDLVPFARMSTPLVSLRGNGEICETATICVLRPVVPDPDKLFPSGSSHGFGISPLGFTRRYLRSSRFSPFVGGNVGGLWFDRLVPTTQASAFNFTASAEAGVRLGPPSEPSFTLTYRFHHISNAGTAGENPGLASHLVTIGLHRPLIRSAR